MPGMMGVWGDNYKNFDPALLMETIDPLSLSNTNMFDTDDVFLAVSSLRNTPLRGSRYYKDSRYIACFSGDLIDTPTVPWNSIIDDFKNNNYQHFADYRGAFAIAIFDRIEKCISIISDRISQQPIFYCIASNGIAFSTAISTFCRLLEAPEFNVDWLYEWTFFNYPIDQTTILKDVQRMPPASILKYDLRTRTSSLFEYAARFKRRDNLIVGRQALEYAWTVFSERVPKYFVGDSEIACSLTGGFDSRVVLSLAPPEIRDSVRIYTYGVDGCFDLLEATKVSDELQLPHTKIIFDDRYLEELPELIYETVYLSNGLQGVNRSTMPYVYRTLSDNGQKFPVTMSGISGDHFFRGQGPVPDIISPAMEQIFMTGEKVVNEELYRAVYGDQFGDFANHVDGVLARLEDVHGEFSLPEAHLSFLVYEVASNHFVGETFIANNYSTIRVPYWDTDIIRLAYEIEYSTLTFSMFLPTRRDPYRENLLQAYLFQRNPEFAKLPIYDVPPTLRSENGKLRYYAYKAVRHGPRVIRSRLKLLCYPRLEEWESWYKTVLAEEVSPLISENSAALNYLNLGFFEQMRQENNIYWLGKIATTEIILNLIKNRWKI
jgi:asparagine synthetase B (glutamine-hydrolysing)